MKLMKNVRTGKIAVYDADLIESGRWEVYVEQTAAPKKPFDQEFLNAKDRVQITLTRADGESVDFVGA